MGLFIPSAITDDIWGTFFFFAIIASLLTLIHLLTHYSNVVIRKTNENIRLQKRYLKLQLNPHFVFNSLSSLAGMIEIEPQKAEEYVIRLSHIYRYMLRHIEEDYITIEEAMDFAEKYVSLLNLRHDDNILFDMDGDIERDSNYILALSLQLLIENAIKHNAPQKDTKLHIQISINNGMLRIKNNRIYTKMRNDQTFESYGIGLKNLEQRYELESGKKIEYLIKPDTFEIRLPIIKNVYKS